MGTRADFYIGRGEKAEWIGSIAWDGYPDGIGKPILKARTEEKFKALITLFFAGRNDATLPADGWPWPWNNSHTTDYSYAFDDGKVWASSFGYAWFDPLKDEPDGELEGEKVTVFPDMTARKKNPPIESKKSGIILIGG